MTPFFSNALFSFKTAKKVIVPSLACMMLMPLSLNADDQSPVVKAVSSQVHKDSGIKPAVGTISPAETGAIILVGDRRERKRKMRRRKVKQLGESIDAIKETTPSSITESIKKTTSSTVSKIKSALGQPAPKKRPGAEFSTPVPKRLITRPSESPVMKHLEELYVNDGKKMPDFRPLIEEYEKNTSGVELKKIEEPKTEITYEDYADPNLNEMKELTPREKRMRKLEEELLEKELLRAEKSLHPEGSTSEIHPDDKVASSEAKKKSFWQKALPFLDRSEKKDEKLKDKLGVDDLYPDMKSIENAPVVSKDEQFVAPSLDAPKAESLKKLIVKKHSPILEKIEKAKEAIEEKESLEKETEAIVKALENKVKASENVKVESKDVAKVEKPAKAAKRPVLDFNSDDDGFKFFDDEEEVDSKMAESKVVEPKKSETPIVKKEIVEKKVPEVKAEDKKIAEKKSSDKTFVKPVPTVVPEVEKAVVQKTEAPTPKFPKANVTTESKFPAAKPVETPKVAATPKVEVKPKGTFPTPVKTTPVQASKNPFQFPKGGIKEADELSKSAPKPGVPAFPTHIVSKTEVKKPEVKKEVEKKAAPFPVVKPAVKSENTKKPAEPKTSVASVSKKVPTRLTSMTSKPTPDPRYQRISSRKNLSGFKGFCPVALRDSRQLVDVQLVYRSTFEGQAYHFSSEEALAMFNANPERYAPASKGQDVVDLKTTGESHIGRLDHAAWFKGQLYLFDSAENRKLFVANPTTYATP